MNKSVGNFSCVVKPFSDNDWLYATSTVFYGLGILGSCILMKNVFAAFSSAKNDKKTIFSIFKAWIEFLVSNNINSRLITAKFDFALDGATIHFLV